MNCTSIYSMLIVDPEMKWSPNTSLSHFFPNPSPHCSMSVIFFQSLLAFIFVSSSSSTYGYSTSNYSTPFWPLLSPLFHILPLQFLQPFLSICDSSSPHYSPSYRYNSSNHSCPLLTLLLSIFSYNFGITSFTHISSIQFMSCLQKRWLLFFFLLMDFLYYF